MNKLKICLTILTIVILVVPIAIELAIYKDNLISLIIPPELNKMINRGEGNNGNSDNAINNNTPDFINPDFGMPQ